MFRRPEAFWLLLLLLPAFLLMVRRYPGGKGVLKRLTGTWRSRGVSDVYLVKYFFSHLGFVGLVVFLVLALADRPGADAPVSYSYRGTDVIFVADISHSMLARDENPTRLEAGLALFAGTGYSRPDNRYGLVVYKGTGQKLIPLSEDIEALDRLLEQVSPALMTNPGTDLDAGLTAALEAFEAGQGRTGVIILLSDGGGAAAVSESVKDHLRREDLRLIVIGAGGKEAVPILLPGGEELKDPQGQPVTTALNSGALEELADDVGGTVLYLSQRGALNGVIDILDSLERSEKERGFRYQTVSRYRGFVLAALFFFLVYFGVRLVRWSDDF